MLHRLFKPKLNQQDIDNKYTHDLLTPEDGEQRELHSQQLRVVVAQPKLLLYDSQYHANRQNRANTMLSSLSLARRGSGNLSRNSMTAGPSPDRENGITNAMRKSLTQKSQPKLDTLEEMIFGTTPVRYKGPYLRVHLYQPHDQPPQLVISKLFPISPQDLDASAEMRRKESFSSIGSDSSGISSPKNQLSWCGPMDVRTPSNERPRSSSIFSLSSSVSQTNPDPSPIRHNPLGVSEVAARLENASGSSNTFALAVIISLPSSFAPDAYAELGRALSSNLHEFIFSHFALIENHVHQLQNSALRALCDVMRRIYAVNGTGVSTTPSSTSGLHPMFDMKLPRLTPLSLQADNCFHDAVERFVSGVITLYSTPRIQQPLWLNMATYPQHRPQYSSSMIKELVYLLRLYDTSEKFYFISNVITTVLSYHVSWVATVAPWEGIKPKSNGGYDPLWAQLSDLRGNIWTPGRVSRTIVVGQDASVVQRLLYVLTYFIRCNEVYETVECRANIPGDPGNLFATRYADEDQLGDLEDQIGNALLGKRSSVDHTSESRKGGVDIPKGGRARSPHSRAASESAPGKVVTSPDSYSISRLPQASDYVSTYVANNWVIEGSSTYLNVPMPKSTVLKLIPDTAADELPAPADSLWMKSFGRSLMVGYCKQYHPDFVLMGIPQLSSLGNLEEDLNCSLKQEGSLMDSVTEAACILADTNKWSCEVIRHLACPDGGKKDQESQRICDRVSHSQFIFETLSTVKCRFTDDDDSLEIVQFIEDRLQQLYFLSKRMIHLLESKYRRESKTIEDHFDPRDLKDIVKSLGLDETDVPLLLNACCTYDEQIQQLYTCQN
ncbi:hypothetical protein BZG36_02760 [Bifiguratus adelaidae]|uniref:UDENN FNIP1/2-type domain-containing protein n=1 Tax=Bifiguratus adelaidae TaxID=1938954 RepID=A0A261Y1Z1_9FUNG|nr:hypothetical protein BZG36_02760 [Bifiguratus adelaidae]